MSPGSPTGRKRFSSEEEEPQRTRKRTTRSESKSQTILFGKISNLTSNFRSVIKKWCGLCSGSCGIIEDGPPNTTNYGIDYQ